MRISANEFFFSRTPSEHGQKLRLLKLGHWHRGPPGADPLGGPEGPWPPQLGQGAPTRRESAPDFGRKYCKVPQLECKSAPNLGANDVKCPS